MDELDPLITIARSKDHAAREDAHRCLIAALAPITIRAGSVFHTLDADDVESAAAAALLALVTGQDPDRPRPCTPYTAGRGKVRSLFYRILYNKCIDLLEHQRVKNGDSAAEAKPPKKLLSRRRRNRLRRAHRLRLKRSMRTGTIHAEENDTPILTIADPNRGIDAVDMADEAAHTWRRVSAGLTTEEKRVFRQQAAGSTYQEIADRLGMNSKRVDNALFQARRKIADAINAE